MRRRQNLTRNSGAIFKSCLAEATHEVCCEKWAVDHYWQQDQQRQEGGFVKNRTLKNQCLQPHKNYPCTHPNYLYCTYLRIIEAMSTNSIIWTPLRSNTYWQSFSVDSLHCSESRIILRLKQKQKILSRLFSSFGYHLFILAFLDSTLNPETPYP